MLKQYEILHCPFCIERTINCTYFPSATKIKISSTSTFGKAQQKRKSSETWIVQSGCNKCGKSMEEVEKKLRDDGII
jgi:hypothetical protein